MKTNSSFYSLAVLGTLMVFTIGCNTATKDGNKAIDSATLMKEIEAANVEFSDYINKGDSVGLANFYTEDAKLMFPNEPAIVGRKNIQTTAHNIISSGIAKADFKALGVWGTSDWATEEGELLLYDKAGTQVDKGKYIVLWKKEAGKWRPFRDLSNSDLPMPSAN